MTSKEFDRFLAERAAAADSLPPINNLNISNNGHQPRPNISSSKNDANSLL